MQPSEFGKLTSWGWAPEHKLFHAHDPYAVTIRSEGTMRLYDRT